MEHSIVLPVLIIEDEPDGQEVVAGILEHFKIMSDVVGSSTEALKMLSERHYSAAMIDLALPDMDGINLLKAIRTNPATAKLPCLVMTAYDSSAVKKQVLEAGGNVYLPKPLNEMQLMQILQRLTNTK